MLILESFVSHSGDWNIRLWSEGSNLFHCSWLKRLDWSDWTEAVCFIALTAGTHTQKICRLQLEAIQENLVKPPDVMLSMPVSKTEITATNLTACSFSSALNNNNNVITSAERRDQLLFLLFFLFRSLSVAMEKGRLWGHSIQQLTVGVPCVQIKKNEEAKQVCEDGLRWNNSPRKDTDFLDTAGNIFAFINLFWITKTHNSQLKLPAFQRCYLQGQNQSQPDGKNWAVD